MEERDYLQTYQGKRAQNSKKLKQKSANQNHLKPHNSIIDRIDHRSDQLHASTYLPKLAEQPIQNTIVLDSQKSQQKQQSLIKSIRLKSPQQLDKLEKLETLKSQSTQNNNPQQRYFQTLQQHQNNLQGGAGGNHHQQQQQLKQRNLVGNNGSHIDPNQTIPNCMMFDSRQLLMANQSPQMIATTSNLISSGVPTSLNKKQRDALIRQNERAKANFQLTQQYTHATSPTVGQTSIISPQLLTSRRKDAETLSKKFLISAVNVHSPQPPETQRNLQTLSQTMSNFGLTKNQFTCSKQLRKEQQQIKFTAILSSPGSNGNLGETNFQEQIRNSAESSQDTAFFNKIKDGLNKNQSQTGQESAQKLKKQDQQPSLEMVEKLKKQIVSQQKMLETQSYTIKRLQNQLQSMKNQSLRDQEATSQLTSTLCNRRRSHLNVEDCIVCPHCYNKIQKGTALKSKFNPLETQEIIDETQNRKNLTKLTQVTHDSIKTLTPGRYASPGANEEQEFNEKDFDRENLKLLQSKSNTNSSFAPSPNLILKNSNGPNRITLKNCDNPNPSKFTAKQIEMLKFTQKDKPKVQIANRDQEFDSLVNDPVYDQNIEQQERCFHCKWWIEPGHYLIELSCGHRIHKKCIEVWFLDHNTCPQCGQEQNLTSLGLSQFKKRYRHIRK